MYFVSIRNKLWQEIQSKIGSPFKGSVPPLLDVIVSHLVLYTGVSSNHGSLPQK
jgi:hypothetical protein